MAISIAVIPKDHISVLLATGDRITISGDMYKRVPASFDGSCGGDKEILTTGFGKKHV